MSRKLESPPRAGTRQSPLLKGSDPLRCIMPAHSPVFSLVFRCLPLLLVFCLPNGPFRTSGSPVTFGPDIVASHLVIPSHLTHAADGREGSFPRHGWLLPVNRYQHHHECDHIQKLHLFFA